MKFQLIIIGNELLNGKIQDKNAHWLAKFCHKNGHNLERVTIVPDEEKSFLTVIKEAYQKVDVVVTTGGMGPTEDDLTKKMLASFFNKKIVFNENASLITQSHYQRNKREYDPKKVSYAYIPEDFTPIYNPKGFAPGLCYQNEKKLLFAAPGVPEEFKQMVKEEFSKVIQKTFPSQNNFTKHIIIKTHKLSESKIFTEIAPSLWESLSPFGQISSLPHSYGVDIGVHIQDVSKELLGKKEKLVLKEIDKSPIKDFIWHIGEESLEELIIQKAKEKKLTFGFAESCTGGLLADRITNVSGSSSVFWGSVTSYANEVKINTLKVKKETLQNFGAVSVEVAKEMAKGAKEVLNVDIVMATSGIAGPLGGSKEKPVGTVAIAFCDKENQGELLHFNGDREQLKYRFSQYALLKLLERINKHSSH